MPGLDLAEVEHIVHQLGQVLAVALNGSDVGQKRGWQANAVDLRRLGDHLANFSATI